MIKNYEREDYAVFDFKRKEFLSKVFISLEEARSFYDLCTNKNKKIITFGWSVVEIEK